MCSAKCSDKSADEPSKSIDELIKLYPNPTNGELFIETNLTESIQYSVYNVNGKIIKEGSIYGIGNIDLLNVDNGVYFIKLMHSNKSFTTKRVIIQH